LPLLITNFTVLETEIATYFPDFLGHLPAASSPSFIEISMQGLVSDKTLKSF